MSEILRKNCRSKETSLFGSGLLILFMLWVSMVGILLITQSLSAQDVMLHTKERNVTNSSSESKSIVTKIANKSSQIIIKELEERFNKLYENIEGFDNIEGDINLQTTEDGIKLLRRSLSKKLSDFMVIDSDDQHIKEYFNARGKSELASILRKWNLPGLRLESYLSIPFFIEAIKEAEEIKYKFFVTKEFLAANDSAFLFYMIFFKTYASLPDYFKAHPSAFAYGLCSLIAGDVLFKSNMAVYPEMEIEAATVLLLIKKNPKLLWEAFPEEDSTRFSSESYISRLKDTITRAGSSELSISLEEILKSPEEYAAISQGVEKEGKNNKGKLPIVPPIEPAMRTLWAILPSTESTLKSTVTWIEQNINNITLKLVLINACHDKLCAIFGSSKAGVLVNSTMLLRQIAEGYLDDQGPRFDAQQFMEMIENQRSSLFEDFIQELSKRGQNEQRLYEIAFDPSTLKWVFRYFYNYSLPIRKKVKELADSIKKEYPGYAEIQIDMEVSKRITSETIYEWWSADPYLRKLFDKIGEPILELKNSPFTRFGKDLKCKWVLKRKGSRDSEEVIVRIIDPFSSGGGKPSPGVSAEAEVVVRKTLESDPEIVKLGTVEKNYYIQTASRIDSIKAIEDDKKDMHEDWARVLVVKQKPTRAPWSLDTGANNPLEVGRIQKIRLEKGDANSDTWEWKLPIKLRKGKDRLLGIKPEGVVKKDESAEFFPFTLKKSGGVDKELQLVILDLSHRDVKNLKESGKGDWGYFANSRFVYAKVKPVPKGVDGNATIQIPKGNKQLDKLIEKNVKEVNAFGFGNPGTFVDKLENVESKLTDYVITISYKLPNGGKKSIQVAEGQSLVVYTSKPRPKIEAKVAYQLKLNDKLVCAFNGERSPPTTATINGLKGEERSLGVYSLNLKELPLVRINDILIPVKTEMVAIFPGVENTTFIQMSPGLDAIRKSTPDSINLAGAQVLIAEHVPMLKVAANDGKPNNHLQVENDSINQDENKIQTKNNNQLLTYSVNSQIEENAFWQATVVDKEPYNSSRYIRIITNHTSLVCGDLQRIFVTGGNSFNELTSKEARDIKKGEKVAFLDKDTGNLSLDRIENIKKMYPSIKADDRVTLLEFVAGESGLYRKSELLIPTMFANGILVEINIAQQGGSTGTGWDGKDKLPGKVPTPQVPGPGKYIPSLEGGVQNFRPEEVIVKFDKEDSTQFDLNRQKLENAFNRLDYKLSKVREQVFESFIKQFFTYTNNKKEIYGHIKDYFKSYLTARDYFVGTGNARVLPALANNYVFLTTLMYEAEAKNAGDVLTRDFLCIVMRTLKSGGKYFFENSATNIRNSLSIIRDLILYVRDKSNKSGFDEHIVGVTFNAESWDKVLTEHFVNQGCNRDMFYEKSDGNVFVNLHNLLLQLDNWVFGKPSFPEAFVAPGFAPGVNGENIFSNNDLAKSLNINQRAIQ